MRNGAVGALQRLDALLTRKAVISLLSCSVSDASVPKCLSRPAMILRHDSAGSSPGAYATWQDEHSCRNMALLRAGITGLPRFSPPYLPLCCSRWLSSYSSSACATDRGAAASSVATASSRRIPFRSDGMAISLIPEGEQIG